MIITFPFWLAIGGVAIGLIAGFFGLVIGLIAGAFGLIIGAIALPFKLIFGWGDWSCDLPSFHGNGFVWLALLIFAALIISKRTGK